MRLTRLPSPYVWWFSLLAYIMVPEAGNVTRCATEAYSHSMVPGGLEVMS
jgi:hypothetical protein